MGKMSESLLLTFTFRLTSITLASKSAGMTLPLEKKKACVIPDICCCSRMCACCGPSINKPLVCVQKDQVFCPKAQSCAGFLDGIVALQEQMSIKVKSNIC